MKLFHSFTFLTKNFGYFGRLSRNSSNTSLTKKRQKERLLLAKLHSMTNPPVVKSVSSLFETFFSLQILHKVKQHFLAEKRQKKKDLLCMTNPPVVRSVPSLAKPNGTDSGTNIRHSLCNSPPPLLLCSCSRDRSFRIDLLFCYVLWGDSCPRGKVYRKSGNTTTLLCILEHMHLWS